MSESPLAVGVDVGGTKAISALVDGTGRVLRHASAPTPTADLEDALVVLVDLVERVRTAAEPVGIGIPGLVDADGVMRSGANVAWRDAPIGARLTDALATEVVVENDCTAGAVGEWLAGAARGADDVVYLGVGTGIGGGFILAGHPYRGAHGFAGEVGHIIVEPGGERCGCGNVGCWETVASGSAITREGRRAVTRHPHSLLAEMAAGDPVGVTGASVTRAAEAGDPAARGILAEVGTRLGEGIAGLVNVFDPELVVIGGGAAGAGEHLLGPARARFAIVAGTRGLADVPIVGSALGADSAVVGAALLASGAAR
jgi:glucokinase